MPKLTKTTIDNMKPEATDVHEWCSELPGFGVKCAPTGRKTYVIRYRTKDGVQRKQKLGRVTDFAIEQARKLARAAFAQVAEGQDPNADRRKDQTAPTVADLEARYTKEWAKPFKKPASQRIDAQNWRLYILPALGAMKVREVTKGDVLSVYGSLSTKPATGIQCLALMSKAFNLAEDWGWRDQNTNPCHRVKRYTLNKRQLILTAEQSAKLNQTMTVMEAERRITASFAKFIRMLMVTGCRKMEILGSKREWIDADGVLHLPDSKTGQRDIKLPTIAKQIMSAGMDAESEWLIPATSGQGHIGNVYRTWARVKEEAGLPPELRLHDLRHTVGSLAHRAGLSQKQVAQALGHKQISTTARYIHDINGDDAVVANTVADSITAAWA